MLITPTSSGIAATAATLGGTVTADGGTAITERGVIYSATATNPNPAIGGTGVTKVTGTGTTGVFTVNVSGLTNGIDYSFKAYAISSAGTGYTSVGTFTTSTPSINADLSGLTLSGGSLNPVFASATTSYTASVTNTTASITVTPTSSEANATLAVRINAGTYAAVSSASPTSAFSLNVGTNTIDVRVTAEDGVTQKIYTVQLTVSPPTNPSGSISTWRQQYFGSDQNSGNAADLATPDGDGIPNLIKYALLMTPGQDGSSRLPQSAMTGPSGNRRLTLTFQRDPSRNDVSIVVEAQSALGGAWSEIARSTNGAAFVGSAAVSETSGANGAKTVTVQDVQANASRRFMRVRVER
jgi:hypothetical protein